MSKLGDKCVLQHLSLAKFKRYFGILYIFISYSLSIFFNGADGKVWFKMLDLASSALLLQGLYFQILFYNILSGLTCVCVLKLIVMSKDP